MPTYEYACRECDRHFDVVQSFSDDALTDCPNCSGALRKVFSAAGIIFKGSGYYVNDSRAQAGAGKTASKTTDAPSSDGNGTSDSGAPSDKSASPAETSTKKSDSGSDSSTSKGASSSEVKKSA